MKNVLVLIMFSLISLSVHAAKNLNSDKSTIHFVSVKKSSIGEVHQFKTFSGKIESGNIEVEIALDSVETQIPIRNQRMRELLFETVKFPNAIIKTQVDAQQLSSLKPGSRLSASVELKVSLHGHVVEVPAELLIIKLSANQVLVSSASPVVINVKDFGLEKGVDALREVAGLPSISTSIPATFNLVFQ